MRLFYTGIIIAVLLQGCGSYNDVDTGPSIVGDLQDNLAWYADERTDVEDYNVSIPVPNPLECAEYNDTAGPLRPCTLNDVDHDMNPYDDYEPKLAVRFFTQEFVPATESTNGVLKQKGKSTRAGKLKSYKIKLDSETNLFRNERRIQLNKQYYDFTRIRNKLSFDLFEGIPNFASLKTEFVDLFIDGRDNGLYTRVETYDKYYLLNRGWDEDDNLYKAQEFWFVLTDELQLDADGKPVDPEAFDSILTIERGKDQKLLIEMLEAVNSSRVDITTVINKYFNRDNYLTWLAVNIITGNIDTSTQNFYLLNPKGSNTFYFLPWDYDGAWDWQHQLGLASMYPRWKSGLARYWDSPLHRKFLSIQQNRADLDEKIYYLKANYFTKEQIQSKVDSYKQLIKKYILRDPDLSTLAYRDSNISKVEEEWNKECDRLADVVDYNIRVYEEEKKNPMPFWQRIDSYENGVLTLKWGEAVDLRGNEVVYDLNVSTTPDFSTTLVSVHDLNETEYKVALDLQPNTEYFMQVIAKEKENPDNYQIAFDEYYGENGIYHGVMKFEVK